MRIHSLLQGSVGDPPDGDWLPKNSPSVVPPDGLAPSPQPNSVPPSDDSNKEEDKGETESGKSQTEYIPPQNPSPQPGYVPTLK